MILSNDDLTILCEVAKTAALNAGKIIGLKQGQKVQVHSKEGGENLASCVVTETDIKAQNTILEGLTPTLKKI